jgi:hypothetical protein
MFQDAGSAVANATQTGMHWLLRDPKILHLMTRFRTVARNECTQRAIWPLTLTGLPQCRNELGKLPSLNALAATIQAYTRSETFTAQASSRGAHGEL